VLLGAVDNSAVAMRVIGWLLQALGKSSEA
jgi:hypothetical protein